MANHSSSNNSSNNTSSSSSNTERPPSAFQWPIPSASSDITIKEILDNYQHDPELLKLVLLAKAEEDKKQTAQSTLQIERTRIQQRMMDLDALRSYPQPPPGAVVYPQQQQQQQPQHHQQQQQQQHHQPYQSASYHSLPPFQQQVIARVTSDHQHNQPASPAGYYPHSAHPLCPPSVPEQPQPQAQAQQQQSTSRSYYYNREQNNHVGKKRPHDAKLSHDQVMEVLKAKLQRGNNAAEKNKRARTLPNPLGSTNTTTTTSSSSLSANNNNTGTTAAATTTTTTTTTATTKPALPPPPPPPQQHPQAHPPLSTPSPRSAKPVLPPIDTSVGRIPSRGPLSSNASHKLPPFSATAALADALVIKGERRVKSLSPPPFATTTTAATATAAATHRNS